MKEHAEINRQVHPDQLANREGSGPPPPVVETKAVALCLAKSPPIKRSGFVWICHKPAGHDGRCQSNSGYSWKAVK